MPMVPPVATSVVEEVKPEILLAATLLLKAQLKELAVPSVKTRRPLRAVEAICVVVNFRAVVEGASTRSAPPVVVAVSVPKVRFVAVPPLGVRVILPPVTAKLKLPRVWLTVAALRPIISKLPPASVRVVAPRKPLAIELLEVSRAILPPLMTIPPVKVLVFAPAGCKVCVPAPILVMARNVAVAGAMIRPVKIVEVSLRPMVRMRATLAVLSVIVPAPASDPIVLAALR